MRQSIAAEAGEPAGVSDPDRGTHAKSISSAESTASGASRRTRGRTLKGLLDVAALTVTVVAATANGLGAAWAAIAVLLCLGLLSMTGQYRLPRSSFSDDLRFAVAVSAIAAMAVAALATAAQGSVSSTGLVVLWLAMTSSLTMVRAVLATANACRWLRGSGTRRTLIIGAGQVGRGAARRLAERPGVGLEPVGFLDLEPLEGGEHDPRVLGASWDLDRVVAEHRIDSVLVGFSSAPHHVILRTVKRCWELGLEVIVVPRLFEVHGVRGRTRHVGGLPLVGLERSSQEGPSLALKGAFDRGVALLALTVLSPLLAVLAMLVKMTSDGPILHRALRVGKDGRPFEMLKFRTMHGDPQERGETHLDWAAENLRSVNGSAGEIALLPRPVAVEDTLTSIGKLLRRTALDELPQLWNVARGEMSLVGPRPELAHLAAMFSTSIYRYEERHRVRPGITGWAQVQGLRGETSLKDRVEWDNFYIENWSFAFDLKIMALTVVALLRS